MSICPDTGKMCFAVDMQLAGLPLGLVPLCQTLQQFSHPHRVTPFNFGDDITSSAAPPFHEHLGTQQPARNMLTSITLTLTLRGISVSLITLNSQRDNLIWSVHRSDMLPGRPKSEFCCSPCPTLSPLATKSRANPAFMSCYVKICLRKNVEKSTACLNFVSMPTLQSGKGLFVLDVLHRKRFHRQKSASLKLRLEQV